MKRDLILIIIIGIVFSNICEAQSKTKKSRGDSLRKAGDIEGAIIEYQEIYKNNKMDLANIYSYAGVLSVEGHLDSAFKYLIISCQKDSTLTPLTDPSFIHLWEDKRWVEFENDHILRVQKRFDKPINDIEYAKKLWRMNARDQAYYDCLKIAQKKTGMNSSVVLAIWDLKNSLNKVNQTELESLLELKGWPKFSQVGNRAANTAFLIIQHSSNEKQKEYLPIIKQLCDQGEAYCQSYALMFDRVQTEDNKPQRYGSQVRYNDQTKKYELFPLEDIRQVDKWRAEVGLEPLAEYVSGWDIKL